MSLLIISLLGFGKLLFCKSVSTSEMTYFLAALPLKQSAAYLVCMACFCM